MGTTGNPGSDRGSGPATADSARPRLGRHARRSVRRRVRRSLSRARRYFIPLASQDQSRPSTRAWPATARRQSPLVPVPTDATRGAPTRRTGPSPERRHSRADDPRSPARAARTARSGSAPSELVVARHRAHHGRGDHAVVSLADIEHEGCRPRRGTRADQLSAPPVGLVPIVTRAGLAADRERRAVGTREYSGEPPCRAALDDTRHDSTHGARHRRRQQSLLGRPARRPGRCGRACRRRTPGALDVDRLSIDAVAHDDAHQLGERRGAIARRAERGSERRHELAEREPHAAPGDRDGIEGVALDQRPNRGDSARRSAAARRAIAGTARAARRCRAHRLSQETSGSRSRSPRYQSSSGCMPVR